MDTETVSKLIEVFATIGADAKWAFVAYLAFRTFVVLAIAGTVITLAVMILKTIKQCSDDSRAYTAIRALFDLQWYEHDKVIRSVTALKDSK